MRTVEVLKYYGYGKWYDVSRAQDKIDALNEKNPDREYTLLRNMRSGKEQYQVAQIEYVVLDWPSDDDLGLPAAQGRRAPGQSWEDLHYEAQKRQNIRNNALQPLRDRLSAALNRPRRRPQ